MSDEKEFPPRPGEETSLKGDVSPPATKPRRKRKIQPVRPEPKVNPDNETEAQREAVRMVEEFRGKHKPTSQRVIDRSVEDDDTAIILCAHCNEPGAFLVELPEGSKIPWNMWYSTYKDVDSPYTVGITCQVCSGRLRVRNDGSGNLTIPGGWDRCITTLKRIEKVKRKTAEQWADYKERKKSSLLLD